MLELYADMPLLFAGSVTALGSVSGPSEVRLRDEIVDRARLEINVLPLRQAPGEPLLPIPYQHYVPLPAPLGALRRLRALVVLTFPTVIASQARNRNRSRRHSQLSSLPSSNCTSTPAL